MGVSLRDKVEMTESELNNKIGSKHDARHGLVRRIPAPHTVGGGRVEAVDPATRRGLDSIREDDRQGIGRLGCTNSSVPGAELADVAGRPARA